ncbi:LysR family transcriptional regulator [Luteolibacter luteus]|uniref:LysR family transcriptional regulator n=1 Tax=Luteolibacter luteus TaxID=2728835 RepID=A0A858RKC4_9BACT|nr:LysR family transcriptional regulator [Luteolibacter luteus]QJE96650.1 LysR family transcriptional regulator [Luteolibacter luteus]
MDLDLACLETFVRLADCGSFSETAVIQKISQPAVSQRIAKLESSTGLRLFLRHQERLEVTRDGKELLEIARKILAEHEGLGIRMSRHVRESKGGVRAMIDGSFAGNRLVKSLQKNPITDTSVEIVRPNGRLSWVEALEQHDVDIVVTGTFLQAGNVPTLQRVELDRQRGTTIAWNRVYFDFDIENFSFPETLRSTILVPSERLISGYLPFLEKWCHDSYGTLPPDVLAFDDEEGARDACVAGLGVLIFPGDAAARMAMNAGELGVVKTFEFLLPDAFSYSIYVRAEERNQRVLQTAVRIADDHRIGKRSPLDHRV